MVSTSDRELIVLEITDPCEVKDKIKQEDISISTSDARSWNVPLILESRIVRVQADRTRLIELSSYFRGLLTGSFSESSLDHVSIQWNLETIIIILQFIYGCSLHVTPNNFLPLMEGALFFGVESLMLECETWFRKILSTRTYLLQMSLDTILEIWNFGLEHGISFLPDLCRGYLARNFAWVISCSSFTDIPFDLLYSCMEHPQLTVDSEKQLCEALLIWVSCNTISSKSSSMNFRNDYFDILKKVRIRLLPLGFASRQRRHFSQFADEIVCAILDLIEDYPSTLVHAITDDTLDNFRIRLTKYSEKIVLSGCSQITGVLLFLALFPYDLDPTLKTRVIHALIELDRFSGNPYQILEKSISMLSFEAVHEVDISKCPRIHFVAAIKWMHTAFPSLRILKASHCLHFKFQDFFYLIHACPLIYEVDLTVDISPVIHTKVSVLSANAEGYELSDGKSYKLQKELTLGKPVRSNISKLTLEGRNEIDDLELLNVSTLSDSLSYLNIKGCTLVTDVGISKLICKCLKIHSLNVSYTSFGRLSVLALCSDHRTFSDGGFLGVHYDHDHPYTIAYGLQQLHIDGCKGVDENSLLQLLKHAVMLKILTLRETSLIDDALNGFIGSSLESLDVSETMVSMQALTYVVRRNSGVRYLKATGCRNLHQHEYNNLSCTGAINFEVLVSNLGKKCVLKEVAFGWGFSTSLLERLKPSFSRLRAITVSLGASLGDHALYVLPKICPLLETMILIFQVISDNVVKSILESLKHLRVLELHCCLGDLTSFSYWINMPKLRTLRLYWVTPWMTNNDLAILCQNCPNLVELSLSGCKLLDSDAQEVISSGWPGMSFIHLEDCGNITSNGVSYLFNCKAVEDLLLRHNGRGIGRNFISDAASKLPLLRKLALDLCDACEGGFDSPSSADRFYLSTVMISCCKRQRSGFELQAEKAFKPVHKETIVLEWNHKELRTTLVKERI